MFDVIGSIIGVLLVFNLGVYVGGHYYDKYSSAVRNAIKKIKELFTRNKKK